VWYGLVSTHARTHTRTHARMHARMHARTHGRTHTRIYIFYTEDKLRYQKRKALRCDLFEEALRRVTSQGLEAALLHVGGGKSAGGNKVKFLRKEFRLRVEGFGWSWVKDEYYKGYQGVDLATGERRDSYAYLKRQLEGVLVDDRELVAPAQPIYPVRWRAGPSLGTASLHRQALDEARDQAAGEESRRLWCVARGRSAASAAVEVLAVVSEISKVKKGHSISHADVNDLVGRGILGAARESALAVCNLQVRWVGG
jgi:hypothetical protein